MQEGKNRQNFTLFDELFIDFKEDLKADLNIDESLTDEELKQFENSCNVIKQHMVE